MDRYKSHEETARNHKPGLNNLLYSLSWVFMAIFGFFALINLYSVIGNIGNPEYGFGVDMILAILVSILLPGGSAFLIWRKKDNLRIEYDYTYTHIGGGKADLDVAKVMGNARRRLMTSLALSSVESAGKVTHPSFQRYLTMRDVKKHNWFVNRGAELYYFYFAKNGVKHVIVLELSDTMIERATQHLGRGIWQG